MVLKTDMSSHAGHVTHLPRHGRSGVFLLAIWAGGLLGSCVFDPFVHVVHDGRDGGVRDAYMDDGSVAEGGVVIGDAAFRRDGSGWTEAGTNQDAALRDSDQDGVPDNADNCPQQANPGQTDRDGDGVGDACDNCPGASNSNQEDLDQDGQGDVCDSDKDGDGLDNEVDPRPEHADEVLLKASGLGLPPVLIWQSGSWNGSGAVCATETSERAVAVVSSPALGADYIVQAKVTGIQKNLAGQPWPSTGLVARWNGALQGYLCVVDLKNHRLVIGKYDGSGWHELHATADVPDRTEYVLRFRLDGSQLTCWVLPEGIHAETSDGAFTSGQAGFFTYYTKACFTYLSVVSLP